MPPLSVRKTSRSPQLADDAPQLAELRAQRRAQQEASRRMEELKMRLFQMTERHIDQAINIIRQWIKQKS